MIRAIDELVIGGTREALNALPAALDRSLPPGWTRRIDVEDRFRAGPVSGLAKNMYCYACEAAPGRPAAMVWIQPRGQSQWSVDSIYAVEHRALSDEEYNQVLDRFATEVLEPVCDELGIKPDKHRLKLDIDDYLSVSASRLLDEFCAGADRTKRSRQDRER